MKITKNRLIAYEWILLIVLMVLNLSYLSFRLAPNWGSLFSLVWMGSFVGLRSFSNIVSGLLIQLMIYPLLLVLLFWRLEKRSKESSYILAYGISICHSFSFIHFYTGIENVCSRCKCLILFAFCLHFRIDF